MCAAIARTGTRLRLASNRPLIRCRLPGPQLPAHTARSPVSPASPAAANAAASSCRTCCQAMPPSRRIASVNPFSESPGIPYTWRTPESFRPPRTGLAKKTDISMIATGISESLLEVGNVSPDSKYGHSPLHSRRADARAAGLVHPRRDVSLHRPRAVGRDRRLVLAVGGAGGGAQGGVHHRGHRADLHRQLRAARPYRCRTGPGARGAAVR